MLGIFEAIKKLCLSDGRDLELLKQASPNMLSILTEEFLKADASSHSYMVPTIAAYAAVADSDALQASFKSVLATYIQVSALASQTPWFSHGSVPPLNVHHRDPIPPF